MRKTIKLRIREPNESYDSSSIGTILFRDWQTSGKWFMYENGTLSTAQIVTNKSIISPYKNHP